MASLEHYHTRFEEEKTYHVYNRSVNGQIIFVNDWHCEYFLKQYDKYISPVAETYAYCILGNHFHLMIRVRPCIDLAVDDLHDSSTQPGHRQTLSRRINTTHDIVSHQFRKFYQSYAITFNRIHNRVGSVFQNPFKRSLVDDDIYFTRLIYYIHSNPQSHGLIDDFRKWKWSSYNKILGDEPSFLKKQEVFKWFGGKNEFEQYHFEEHQTVKTKLFFEE